MFISYWRVVFFQIITIMSLLKFAKLPLHKGKFWINLKLFSKWHSVHLGLATTFFRNLTTVSQKTVLPQILHVINNNNHWIWQKQDSFKLPINNIQPIKLPNNLLWLPINEPEKINTVIETPPTVNDETKQAARLIIIRRKKMKKHKLKKLRKKMKYVWAKVCNF